MCQCTRGMWARLGVSVPGCGCGFMGVYVHLHMPLLVKNNMAGLIKGAIPAAPLL